LSCSGIAVATTIVVDESNSAAGQVLLLGGYDEEGVGLSTGAPSRSCPRRDLCTLQAALLSSRAGFAAVRIPDGRVACVGGLGSLSAAEVWGLPASLAPNAAWTWTQLPALSVGRYGSFGCVMIDGHFAVLGGRSNGGDTPSCEALMVDSIHRDDHWHSLPSMHHARRNFACAAVARCILVAGGGHGPPSADRSVR